MRKRLWRRIASLIMGFMIEAVQANTLSSSDCVEVCKRHWINTIRLIRVFENIAVSV